MDKIKVWKRTIDLDEFFIEESDDETRAVSQNGSVVQKFKK